MAKLHEELDMSLVRAGIQNITATASPCLGVGGTFGPTLYPKLGHPQQRVGGKRWPRGDSLLRSLWPCSRGCRSSAVASESVARAPTRKWSTSPGFHTLPSPSPLCPHHMDEQLHHSLRKLHLQWESRRRGVSRMWPDSAPTHAAGHPIPHQDQLQSVCPGTCKETGPLWPYQRPGWHTAITQWLGLHLGRCHWADWHFTSTCPLGCEFPKVTPQWWWPTSWQPTGREEPGQRPIPLHQTSLWLPVGLEPGAQHHQTPWEGP